MSVAMIDSVDEGIASLIHVTEFYTGHHYSQEAEADSIGEPELEACIAYHSRQAKLWDQVTKKLQALLVEKGS